jgi:hypothetical protein
MKKSLGIAGASIAAGGATFGATHLMLEYMSLDPSEANASVERCAAVLGQEATTAANLPDACKPVDYMFDYKTTEVVLHHLTDDTAEVVRTTKSYLLPSRKAFVSVNFQTKEVIAQDNNLRSKTEEAAGIISAVAIAAMLGVLYKKPKSTDDETPSPARA